MGATVGVRGGGDLQLQRWRPDGWRHRAPTRHRRRTPPRTSWWTVLQTDAFAGCTTSAAANVGNTTAINVTGPAGVSLTNESLHDPDVPHRPTTTANWGKINWTVNLGDNGVLPPGDTFTVDNSGNTDAGVETDWGVNGVDLNGDGDLDVVLGGIETSQDFAGDRHGPSRRRATPSTPAAAPRPARPTRPRSRSTALLALGDQDAHRWRWQRLDHRRCRRRLRSRAASATTASTATAARTPWTTRHPRPRSR